MSKRQQVTATRVANVPAAEFEAVIESDDPPSITKLAEAGKKAQEALGFDYLKGRDPAQFNAAIHTLGAIRQLAEKCAAHRPAFVAAGVDPNEIMEVQNLVARVDEWLQLFFGELETDG